MNLFTPALGAAADVLDLAAELAGALTTAAERLAIAVLEDGRGGVVSDNDDRSEAAAPVAVGQDSAAAGRERSVSRILTARALGSGAGPEVVGRSVVGAGRARARSADPPECRPTWVPRG
jgi:hypothetical protein